MSSTKILAENASYFEKSKERLSIFVNLLTLCQSIDNSSALIVPASSILKLKPDISVIFTKDSLRIVTKPSDLLNSKDPKDKSSVFNFTKFPIS